MLIAMQSPLITQKEANRSYSSSIPPSSFAIMQEATNTGEANDPRVSPTGTVRPEQANTLNSSSIETPPHNSLLIPSSNGERYSPVVRRNISSPIGGQIGSPLTLLGNTSEADNNSKLNQSLLSPRCTSTPLFAYAGTPLTEEQFPQQLPTTPQPYRPPPTTHVFFAMDRASPPAAGAPTTTTTMAAPRSHHRHTQQQQPLHWNMGGSSMGVVSSPRSGAASTNITPRSMMLQPIHSHGPRTPPEVLKTLLRKKACLYEAGTSYAIAIVTWLVGRSLTVTYGYFSRQQLQYGVHQAVSDIIDSGNITRTKVNRCMQIILNSCFHYVIPHPKTDEVSSRRFRDKFQSLIEKHDDAYYLLQTLDPPWDSLDLFGAIEGFLKHGDESDSVYKIEQEEEELHRREHHAATKSPQRREGESPTDINDDGSCSIKRAVLLCFNENVTSFEDVWRCHNEFIRDVARAGNLRLTAQEWKDFFSRDVTLASHARISSRITAAASSTGHAFAADTSSEDGSYSIGSSPRLPPLHPSPASLSQQSNRATLPAEPLIPELFLDGRHQHHHHPQSYAAAVAATPPNTIDDDKHSAEIDQRFGVMDDNELCKFRTQWCTKRYDHDPRVCTFAHTKANQGWLRRNPSLYSYKDEFCPNILTISRPGYFLDGCFFNMCPDGVHCEFCHSQEEMEYHPNRYKHQRQICPMFPKVSKDGGDLFDSCYRDQTCPFVHPIVKSMHSGAMIHGRMSSEGMSSSGGGMRYSSTGRAQHNPRSPRMQGKQHPDVPSSFMRDLATPARSPMMYVSPAPESMFENSLALPGLKSLFRQHSSVLYSYVCGGARRSTADSTLTTDQGNIRLYQYFLNTNET